MNWIAVMALFAIACGGTSGERGQKNTWQVGPFAVTIETPSGWEWKSQDTGGVAFLSSHVHTRGMQSVLKVGSTCGGQCYTFTRDEIAERAEKHAREKFGSLKGARWLQPLKEIRRGVWRFQIRGRRGGREVTIVEVIRGDERVPDRYLRCSAKLDPIDAKRAAEMERICLELKTSPDEFLGPTAPRKLPLGDGSAMEVAPPDGWKFSYLRQSGFYKYSAPLAEGGDLVKDHPRGSLGFTAMRAGASWVYVEIEDKPRAKSEYEIVQKQAAKKLENHNDTRAIRSGAGDASRRVELEPPSELGEHLHFFRISVTGKYSYEWQETLAFRSGARTYFKCSAWPSEPNFPHRSMLQQYCRDLATAWQAR